MLETTRADGRHVLHRIHGAGVVFEDGAADDVGGFGMLGKSYDHAIRADDAGFFTGDRGEGVAEKGLMVESDVRDYRDAGIDDVGGVEAATHANFEHRDFNAGAREIFEGHGGEDFEKARVPGQFAAREQLAAADLDAGVNFGEFGVGDFAVARLDAFIDANEMRGSVQAGPVSGGGQNGIQRSRS